MELATGNHSHKVPGSRNGVEGRGRHFIKLWYEGVYLCGTINYYLERDPDSSGSIFSGRCVFKKTKTIYICAINEKTNLHKHIRNIQNSTSRSYCTYSVYYLTKTTSIRYQ